MCEMWCFVCSACRLISIACSSTSDHSGHAGIFEFIRPVNYANFRFFCSHGNGEFDAGELWSAWLTLLAGCYITDNMSDRTLLHQPAQPRLLSSDGNGAGRTVRDITRLFELTELLHQSQRTSVHRARRREDGLEGAFSLATMS